MGYNTIEFSVADAVATLTLNRPDTLNSFNDEMHAEVRDALEKVQADDNVRCLLLTGSGRGFCAGQDLSDRHMMPGEDARDLGSTLESNYNPLIRTLKSLDLPVVCAVNGVAAGAGANIALACDIVLAGRSVKFIQAFCKVGLIPDSGGTWTLPRLVGKARAMGLSMLGEAVTAEQAEQRTVTGELRNHAEGVLTDMSSWLQYHRQFIPPRSVDRLEAVLGKLELKIEKGDTRGIRAALKKLDELSAPYRQAG